jgi:hypothetical protein
MTTLAALALCLCLLAQQPHTNTDAEVVLKKDRVTLEDVSKDLRIIAVASASSERKYLLLIFQKDQTYDGDAPVVIVNDKKKKLSMPCKMNKSGHILHAILSLEQANQLAASTSIEFQMPDGVSFALGPKQLAALRETIKKLPNAVPKPVAPPSSLEEVEEALDKLHVRYAELGEQVQRDLENKDYTAASTTQRKMAEVTAKTNALRRQREKLREAKKK